MGESEYEADSEIETAGAVEVCLPADKGISANPSLPLSSVPICGGDAN